MPTDCYSFTGKTIEIKIKDDTFHVHKGIICSTSEFFKNAVKMEWAGAGKPIDLSNESRDTFNIYLGWLYAKNLSHVSCTSTAWTQLTEAYIIGEKFIDTTFQMAVIDAMIIHHTANPSKYFPSIENVNCIYEGTVESSPARRFMVDLCVWKDGTSPWVKGKLTAYMHEDFLDDLLVALLDQRKPPAGRSRVPWLKSVVYYPTP